MSAPQFPAPFLPETNSRSSEDETVFSVIKRTIGDEVRSVGVEGQYNEMRFKVITYNAARMASLACSLFRGFLQSLLTGFVNLLQILPRDVRFLIQSRGASRLSLDFRLGCQTSRRFFFIFGGTEDPASLGGIRHASNNPNATRLSHAPLVHGRRIDFCPSREQFHTNRLDDHSQDTWNIRSCPILIQQPLLLIRSGGIRDWREKKKRRIALQSHR